MTPERPKPVQAKIILRQTSGEGLVLVPEKPQEVYRFDPGTVIYPYGWSSGFEIRAHAVLADRLGSTKRGKHPKINGLTAFRLREEAVGFPFSGKHCITLSAGTTFGAYARTAHKQIVKK